MRIVHTDGKWFLNSGWYAFTDAETGVTFQPGEITKAKETAWIKGQPTIREVPDPLAKTPVKPAK